MRALKRIAIVFAGLVGLLMIVALFLPSEYQASESIVIEAPADVIFAEIDDVRTWESWTVWNSTEDPGLTYSYPGPDRGEGATVTWHSEDAGSGKRVVTRSVPHEKLSFDLFFSEDAAPAKALIELRTQPDGTQVVWSMRGDMGMMLPARYMIGMLEDVVRSDFARSLDGLKRRCEAKAKEKAEVGPAASP